ncbi:MAG: AAA family ATPase [Reichenbachiella sp.]|uniref:ATP-dependent nuclease n=1 Tax=Reichenbachiella sp. TaxID=2184521 RepID=UPI002966BBCC|nr:AAA family ATPase [Reichenbachiella sp.]MDW3209521.1 AAA family ATPase [Reichenbachiella sp.]
MYLSQLIISNFRSIKYMELTFQKGVNILIGENNSGKSAIIDALRIGLGFGKPDNTISIRETDLHINKNDPNEQNSEIQLDFIFEIEDEIREKQCFYDFLSQDKSDPEKQTIQFHIKYSYVHRGKRNFFKRTIWGGDNEGQLIPYEALEEIFFIYLDPLRDAVYSLKPYSYNNKVGNLFNELTKYSKGGAEIPLDEEKKKQLAAELYQVFEGEESDWESILQTGNEKVNDHLKGTGISAKYPNIKMNYLGRKYSDVVRGIELKRPVYNAELNGEQKYFEIHQNGLGENNLIYASVVLGDLINRCEDQELQLYNALLVEEPEAHLHPQYQNTFFAYLNKLQDTGVQLFITSHSPTITAKSDMENITVLQKQEEKIAPFIFSVLSTEDFSIRNRNHLKKFLDTSKAQLLFANGVILVEGIAEALLLPILSKQFLNIDLDEYGIEIVNINGVAFEHFAKLFNNEDEKKRLLARCSIITDSDPVVGKPKSDRALKAETFAAANLKVCLAPNSLEIDLFNCADVNKSVMRFVYRGLHPQTADLLNQFEADSLWEKLNSNRDKGDFALELQNILSDVEGFEVPEYIKDAISWVTRLEEENVQQANG